MLEESRATPEVASGKILRFPVGKSRALGLYSERMKFHIFTCALVATLVATLCLSQPVLGQEADKKESPLAKQMEAMNDAYKAIKKETDPAKGATLARTAQDALLKSLAEVPELVTKGAEADKAKSVANYRTMIGKAFVSFSEIEEAFIAKDLEKVKTLVEGLREMKKEGHDKYMEDEG